MQVQKRESRTCTALKKINKPLIRLSSLSLLSHLLSLSVLFSPLLNFSSHLLCLWSSEDHKKKIKDMQQEASTNGSN